MNMWTPKSVRDISCKNFHVFLFVGLCHAPVFLTGKQHSANRRLNSSKSFHIPRGASSSLDEGSDWLPHFCNQSYCKDAYSNGKLPRFSNQSYCEDDLSATWGSLARPAWAPTSTPRLVTKSWWTCEQVIFRPQPSPHKHAWSQF